MSNENEVHFCGHCPREQTTSKGEKCISCGKMTIIWDKSRYPSRDWAFQQWKDMSKYYN
jgi:hypothetical protein